MDKFVCGIELAKELYKRGIVKDAEFWHFNMFNKESIQMFDGVERIGSDIKSVCPAPIAEELMELLPSRFESKDDWHYLSTRKNSILHFISYDSKLHPIKIISDKKESNARAKMLIWLDDEGYLKGVK